MWLVVKPVFSEFSYGFALTHELVNRFSVALAAAPVFPSLITEGRSGGYDAALPLAGWTVFLQFKVSQYMTRSTAMHWDHYAHPYFRFPIRPSSYSEQHKLLLELAAKTYLAHFVAYVAPGFHELHDLNDNFLSGRVAENSVWVPVQSIGAIADTAEHWITFDSVDDPPRFFSEPRSLTAVLKGESVAGLFENGPAGATSEPLGDEFFRRLAATMVEIAGGDVRSDLVEQLGGRDYTPQAACGYLARVMFDSELLLVSDRFPSPSG